MEESKTIMIALTPQNFHIWLKELKGIAEKVKVWEFVDPDGQQIELESVKFLEVSDYQMLIVSHPLTSIIAEGGAALSQAPQTPETRSAEDFEELTKDQQRSFQTKMIIYQMKKKLVEKMTHDMRIVENALKTSTRTYILSADMDALIRDIIKRLADIY